VSAPSTEAEAAAGGRKKSPFTDLEALTVPVEGGVTFTVRVLPADDPAAPVALILPAMALKAKFYLPLATALHRAGVSVALCDLRGQGEATPGLREQPNFGYRELVEVDVPAVVAAVRGRFPAGPLFLFGHSLGGQLAFLHTATAAQSVDPGPIAGIVTIGTGTVFWKAFGWRRWIEAIGSIQWIGVVARVRGYWPGGILIGGAMPGRVMTDWARHSRTSRYRPAGSRRDYDRALRELTVPALVISLEDDRLGPASNVDFLCRRIPSAALTRWHIDAASGVVNRDHFAWIKDSAVIGPAVAAWLRDGTAPPGSTTRSR